MNDEIYASGALIIFLVSQLRVHSYCMNTIVAMQTCVALKA